MSVETPSRTVTIGRLRAHELMDAMDRSDAPGGSSGRSKAKTGSWAKYRHNDILIRFEHPGGGFSENHTYTRSLSKTGLRLLWNGYVHPSTLVRAHLHTVWGGREVVEGVVVSCSHVSGNVHCVEAVFSLHDSGPIDLRNFLSDQAALAKVMFRDTKPESVRGSIVYLEQEPLLADLAKNLLRETAVQVHPSQNLEEALEALRASPVDLVLCGLDLGESTGEEAIRAIRGAAFRGPIIVVTGVSDPQRHDAAKQAGANAIVFKPFDRTTLIGVMAHWIGADGSGSSHRALYSTLGGDPGIRELLPMFIERASVLVEELRGAAGAGEIDAVRRISTEIEQNSATFGFKEFAQAARGVLTSLDATCSVEESMQEIMRLEEMSRLLKPSAAPG